MEQTYTEGTKVARRVINPTVVKSAGDATLDQILKLSSQIAKSKRNSQ